MRNIKLKKVGIVVSTACLGLVISTAQAAPLIPFSNGSVADADDVNTNFTELETRINTISLTPGPTGPQGPQGIAGTNGADGATGSTGPQGIAGTNGADGATGSTGPQGTAGTNGADGATGSTGPQGIAGTNGADGATGSTGPQGTEGTNGADGATGSTGPQGTAGINGANGLDGAPGPAGPQGNQGNQGNQGIQGIQGIQGPIGATGSAGSGVVTVSWPGFSASGWDQKTFIVTGGGNFDKEVRTYARFPVDANTGTTQVTRQRTDSNILVNGMPLVRKHQVLHYSYDVTDKIAFTQMDNYSPSNTAQLNNTITINPGYNVANTVMNIGMNWSTGSVLTINDIIGPNPDIIGHGIDTRSLLAVENITVQGVAYTGCLKILHIRSATTLGRQFQRINWNCPNSVGLVKQIHIDATSSTSRMLEFDPAQSIAVPGV